MEKVLILRKRHINSESHQIINPQNTFNYSIVLSFIFFPDTKMRANKHSSILVSALLIIWFQFCNHKAKATVVKRWESLRFILRVRPVALKTCKIFHIHCIFYSGFMCQTIVSLE